MSRKHCGGQRARERKPKRAGVRAPVHRACAVAQTLLAEADDARAVLLGDLDARVVLGLLVGGAVGDQVGDVRVEAAALDVLRSGSCRLYDDRKSL